MGANPTMFSDMQHSQVFEPIVRLDTIDVVHMLPWLQLPTKVLFHNPPMLEVADAIYGYSAIFAAIVCSLILGVARLGAELFGFFSGFWARKNNFAGQARDGALLVFGAHPANLRAKSRFVLSVCLNFKQGVAMPAAQRDHLDFVAAEAGRCNG